MPPGGLWQVSARTQRGILLLADVSGFTAFLAQTELEHAHDILLGLLRPVVERLQPSLTIAEVEGDAVFAYAPDGRFPRGETLLEAIEQTYAAFLGRIEAIRLHTTCSCTACRAVPILDLKFIVHQGEYILQAVSGAGKPLGSDVNLAHRLLKNGVGAATGWRAYGLLTEDATRHLGLPTHEMHEQVEAIADLRTVRVFCFDLRERWHRARQQRQILVTGTDADVEVAVDLPAPPPVVWDWLNDPQRCSRWVGLEIDQKRPPDGRSGVGTTTHCTHGAKLESVHTVLDWHPFDYFTEQIGRPGDGRAQALSSFVLQPAGNGTRLVGRYRVLMKPRWISVPVFRQSAVPGIRSSFERLKALISEDSGEAASSPAAPGSPLRASASLPPGQGRPNPDPSP
jgi:class 3 adenylate cyclase